MPYFYYYMDQYYLILVLPAILFSLWAQLSISSAFRRYSKVHTKRGVTGAMAAEAVLRQNGIDDVRIERVSGSLTDHYDPRNKVIRLSESVYGSTSVASAGVAAHEAGHAVQHAAGYAPVKLRNAVVPVASIGSTLSVPLLLLGLFLGYTGLIYAGIICMSAAVAFQLITLPVELNASRRALAALEEGRLLYEDEVPGAEKVLRAAAMTYVAALALTVAQMLRFILLFGGRRNRR